MNRPRFFDLIRHAPFPGRLKAGQVDGITRIIDEWDKRRLINLWWLAYILATVFHETAATMQPIRERGSKKYLQSKAYYPWYGRGLVQITWEPNYRKFGIKNPDDALEWNTALRVLYEGMMGGMFTGHKLSEYFHDLPNDGPTARRIVNKMDKAQKIWRYAVQFHDALVAAQ